MKNIENNDGKLTYHMRIQVYNKDRKFGPGVAALMKYVREYGSLSRACQEMNMAYSKAWKIISQSENDLGFPLMEGKRGGKHGGRTMLTAEGEEFLNQYLAFMEESKAAVSELFDKYFTKQYPEK